MLATSREALAIPGEVALPVPPLALPDFRRLPDVEYLSRYESARLFAKRAAVRPDFVLKEQNATELSRVCYRLDGIPLALELAAARTKVMSVEEIAERLDDSFGLFASGLRTAMPRQRTLRATMDWWSHDLLGPAERTLFRRLSVFVGGFNLSAAESVCAGEGLERDDVPEVLFQLVDKSLVTAQERGGATRYRLLEMVRQYGTRSSTTPRTKLGGGTPLFLRGLRRRQRGN